MRSRFTRSVFVVLAATFGAGNIVSESLAHAADPVPVASVEVEDAASPEGVLRSFLLAVLDANLEVAKEKSIPNEGLEGVINSPQRPPAEVLEPMRATVSQLPIRRMKVGEEVSLPSGKRFKITKAMVTEDRLQLTMTAMPIPFDLRQVNGVWKVDPQMMIDSQKAAAKSRGGKKFKN